MAGAVEHLNRLLERTDRLPRTGWKYYRVSAARLAATHAVLGISRNGLLEGQGSRHKQAVGTVARGCPSR